MAVVKHAGSEYWYYSFQLNGKKYFKSTKTTNKTLARQIEAKAREQAAKEAALGREAEKITLLEAYDLNMRSKEGTPYHKVLTSIRNPVLFGTKRCNKTKKQVKVYALDRHMPLQHLRSADINRLVDARKREGYADATVKQHVMAVASAWKWAKDHGYLVDEAMTFPSFKRERKQPVFLTPEEERRLIDSLDPKAYRQGYGHYENRTPERQQRLQDQHDFVVGLLDVGCRFSELAALTWDRVDLEAGVVYLYQTKTKKAHTVYLTTRFKEILSQRAASKCHEKWVFPNDERNGPRAFHNMWFNRAVKRAGIEGKKITHHKMRSTFASRLVQSGVSLFEVQQLLGHSDPTTTLVYASLVPTEVSKKAAAVLDQIRSSQ